MRSDYGLYIVAVICFIIVGVFAANISGYTIAEETSRIAVMVILFIVGIISAAVGYSARPKEIMRTPSPPSIPVTPPPETPPPPPPAQPSTEEIVPEPSPLEPSASAEVEEVAEVSEDLPPTPAAEIAPEPTPTIAPEEPPKAVEEEKPKTRRTRRRRKKAE